jgi:5-methylcytosine-specific restriction protein A
VKPDLSIIPEPDRSVEPRKPLTAKQRAELALAQGGRCGCGCGGKLDHAGEGTIDEHVIALGLQGTNALPNRSLWRKPCSDAKTFGKDIPAIAKAKRIEARETGTRRERKPIGGRGFGDRTRKFSGEVSLTKAARRQAEGGCDKLAGYAARQRGVDQ